MLKGPQAIIGGIVHNTTEERLEGLAVELELKGRKNGANETRTLKVAPQDLGPGEKGRYSISVASRDWSGARIVRLRGDNRPEDIAFKS
ncbi:MAG: hypothetical protein ACRD68_19060, partial [Pyrinomonadaceae bacterium]